MGAKRKEKDIFCYLNNLTMMIVKLRVCAFKYIYVYNVHTDLFKSIIE